MDLYRILAKSGPVSDHRLAWTGYPYIHQTIITVSVSSFMKNVYWENEFSHNKIFASTIHSICGPSPDGDFQTSSPGLLPFHKTKSHLILFPSLVIPDVTNGPSPWLDVELSFKPSDSNLDMNVVDEIWSLCVLRFRSRARSTISQQKLYIRYKSSNNDKVTSYIHTIDNIRTKIIW